jgi:pumilio family protein 6
MLKALVQGGRFDRDTKSVKLTEPPLGFADLLYVKIKDHILLWASGPDSFVIVAMLEAHDFSGRETLMKELKQHRAQLVEVGEAVSYREGGNAGARILVQKIDEA